MEDFRDAENDEARALSAIRNLTAGLLLLFKVKLQELSPAGSKEALLKQTVTPVLDADGNPIWIGTGSKTVDVQTIILRLKGLGVDGVDWHRLEALTKLPNDVEHYFSPHPASVLLEAMEASFHLIQQFAPKHLGKSPLQLLGNDLSSRRMPSTRMNFTFARRLPKQFFGHFLCWQSPLGACVALAADQSCSNPTYPLLSLQKQALNARAAAL